MGDFVLPKYPCGMAFEPAGEVIQVPGLMPVYRPHHRTVEILTGYILRYPKEHRHYVERLWDHYADMHPLEVVCMFHQAMTEHYDFYKSDGDFWANTAVRLHLCFEADADKLGVSMLILAGAPRLLVCVWFDPPDVRVF